MSSENVQWSKSSFCQSDGCVEVGFRRSSACNSDGCVEADTSGDVVLVRDSKLGVFSPVASFSHAEWRRLIAEPALLWLVLAVDGLHFSQSEMVVFEYGLSAGEFGLVSA